MGASIESRISRMRKHPADYDLSRSLAAGRGDQAIGRETAAVRVLRCHAARLNNGRGADDAAPLHIPTPASGVDQDVGVQVGAIASSISPGRISLPAPSIYPALTVISERGEIPAD